MNKIDIKIGNKEYEVLVAETEEEKTKGLQDVEELDDDEGMLFVYNEPQQVVFWMQDTTIPLDIVFINDDFEVISIQKGVPLSEDLIAEDNVLYVLEVSQNSGIQVGDILEFDDLDEDIEINEMYIIGPNGKEQAVLSGGERIFSRLNTRTLVNLAKKAYKSKLDTDYKALGRKVFSYLAKQDLNETQYVEAPK